MLKRQEIKNLEKKKKGVSKQEKAEAKQPAVSLVCQLLHSELTCVQGIRILGTAQPAMRGSGVLMGLIAMHCYQGYFTLDFGLTTFDFACALRFVIYHDERPLTWYACAIRQQLQQDANESCCPVC